MSLVLSLFPGIGLLDLAFELEGFCVVRGPDVIWGGDIRAFHPPSGRFDGVIGGPPCQAFSQLANLVRAQGHQPKFGNLIPEFERCVAEAAPAWFLMENVPSAPVPVVAGYGVHTQRLNNRWLGAEQHRLRAFSFGVRGAAQQLAIETVALEPALRHRPTVTGDRVVPRSGRQYAGPAVHQGNGTGKNVTGGKMWRYTIAEALELQGLTPDFLAHAPFTAAGKLAAVANGVPLPMGRAVAQAVLRAVANGCKLPSTTTL